MAERRAPALSAALAPVAGGRVLWVDVEPVATEAAGAQSATLDALPGGRPFDAAVIGAAAEPMEAVGAVRPCVREGGVLALVVPIPREGVRGATQRAALMFDRRAKVRALEDACAALLEHGASRVEVIEVEGARGEVVVHGVIAPSL